MLTRNAIGSLAKALSVMVVLVACGGATTNSVGVSAATTVAPGETTDPPETSAIVSTTPTAPAEASGLERATGTGVVTVDDETFTVEVINCGWRPALTSDPLTASPDFTNDLNLVAIAEVGDNGFFAVEVSRDPTMPLLTLSVARVEASSTQGNYWWSNDRQNPRRVEIDGHRVWSPESLIVFEDPLDMGSAEHAVTFDITCDTYGGVLGDVLEVAAEVTGLPFVPPPTAAVGHVQVNGEPYEVTTTSCDHAGDEFSLVADSADGSLQLVLTVWPLSDKIFVKFGGERMVNAGGEEVVVDGEILRSPGLVPLVGQVSGESSGEVSFEVTCG